MPVINYDKFPISSNYADNYISGRLKTQLEYYDTSSIKLQRRYQQFTIANIIITAMIPVVTVIESWWNPVGKFVIALLGAIASILTSIAFFEKYKDKWTQYRFTYEKLESELAQYNTCTCKYNIENPTERLYILVETCESILDREHSVWIETVKKES